jgi:nitrite reductase (NO-forming)
MPPPITRANQAIVEVEFEVVEEVRTIDPVRGVEFETWGYRIVGGDDGVVSGTPGPVIRARVGDVLRFTIANPASNTHPHNVDFHSVTGQGGGAEATTVAPGETKTIEARLLYPGFFMYHCAYGDIPQHLSHGMHGGILVEPETPLPTVDHEWYIVQSESSTRLGSPVSSNSIGPPYGTSRRHTWCSTVRWVRWQATTPSGCKWENGPGSTS